MVQLNTRIVFVRQIEVTVSSQRVSSSGDSLPNVKGRLQERLPFWKESGTRNWVTRILKEGYALPFTNKPEPAFFNNNRSALNNREFVTKEILDLLT